MNRCKDVGVRFHAEHRFSGPPDAVIGLLVDPEFHRELQLPDMSLPDVLDSNSEGDVTSLRLRYHYTGQLDPIATRLLGNRTLTWLQELRMDRSSGAGRLTFAAEADPKRLHGSADIVIEAVEGASRRLVDGELTVAVLAVGGMAARRIIPGLLRRLDIEAQVLDQRLRAG
jgi:hypothetical protein